LLGLGYGNHMSADEQLFPGVQRVEVGKNAFSDGSHVQKPIQLFVLIQVQIPTGKFQEERQSIPHRLRPGGLALRRRVGGAGSMRRRSAWPIRPSCTGETDFSFSHPTSGAGQTVLLITARRERVGVFVWPLY
jgi:hypothetical protein